MGRRDKKRYHIVRKNKADTRALLRALVSGYLLYLAWKLAGSSGDSSFPPLLGWLAGGVFAAAAVGFGTYTWITYRRALKEAELTPEEEAELRREEE